MLEKFYFESFLIAFSALVGAIFSYVFIKIIEVSGMSVQMKIFILAILFLITIALIMLILWGVISLLGIIHLRKQKNNLK